jgi:hypothetical protein
MHRHARCLTLIAALTVGSGNLSADEVGAPALKAAFLVNFLKFVEWPPESQADRTFLRVCVFDDVAVAGELTTIIGGQKIGGVTVQVLKTDTTTALSRCQMLYVGAATLDNARSVIEAVRDQAVLTVSDTTGFAGAAGIIELYADNGKMRFAVNLAAAKRARLQLSSKLLTLARIVDGPSR